MSSSTSLEQAWGLLDTVLDPEVPVLSLRDLGVVRDVIEHEHGFDVVLTPTYSGCPATEVIARSVQDAFAAAGLGPATVSYRLAPAWTSDWISAEGRKRLREYGIAPPHALADTGADAGAGTGAGAGAGTATERPLRFRPPNIECPRCVSRHTEMLSAFGATACKALCRCLACREPFEYFKPL